MKFGVQRSSFFLNLKKFSSLFLVRAYSAWKQTLFFLLALV